MQSVDSKIKFFSVILFIVFIVTNSKIAVSSETDALSADDIAYIKDALQKTKDKLKDPDSAKFKNLVYYKSAFSVVCGEINAKNSYGAYNGFKLFYQTSMDLIGGIASGDDARVTLNMMGRQCSSSKGTPIPFDEKILTGQSQ